MINAAGEVVSGANVYVESDNAGLTQIATGLSDASGKFSITLRELGNYTVFGSKEEDGYPLTVSGGIRKPEAIQLKQGESKNLHIALHKHVRQ